jgi:hypothetical protein
MQWSELKPVNPESAKTITVIGLLVVVVMLNLCTLHYDMYDKNSLLQIKTTDTKTLLQIKQIDHGLRQVVEQLHQSKSLSEETLKSVASKLTEIQSVLDKLPTQDNLLQLQTSVAHINQQLAKNTIATSPTIHSKSKAKSGHAYKRTLTPTALPFTVTGIDVWNGEPAATINVNGAPDLMEKNDTRYGWTLVALAFDSRLAVFRNAHRQMVKVDFA